jgi:hypothetical protein
MPLGRIVALEIVDLARQFIHAAHLRLRIGAVDLHSQ